MIIEIEFEKNERTVYVALDRSTCDDYEFETVDDIPEIIRGIIHNYEMANNIEE